MNSPQVVAEIRNEVQKRRTFAIISHPDAGKTTLTEKLLLYAGMIRTAGMVHGRKTKAHVSSDWMEMERERGISITASAMQFAYKNALINVLDTPGHQDFSEDTYRTLTAADSAVMVIDAAKGIETQTRKLFEVCRLRKIPILTFINKMDLHGEDPFHLVAEVEEVLKIKAAPVNWPIGMGDAFRGVADCATGEIILFDTTVSGSTKVKAERCTLEQALAAGKIDADKAETLRYELQLLKEAGNPFCRESFLRGELTPVFFGSAMTNFGVEPFFDAFVELAPPPGARPATTRAGEEILVDPLTEPFSAYVFKMQANMDRKHRDSMAFLRICSGRFERDLLVTHERAERELRLSRSHSMFGGERTILDVAYPGDIVGVVNPGAFAIGDTISVSGGFSFKPLPQFPPEVIAKIRPKDLTKRKAFDKGMKQFANEGAILVLTRWGSKLTEPLIAAVGRLQFEVLQHRLEHEYGVNTQIDELPLQHGSWIIGDVATFKPTPSSLVAEDPHGRALVLYTYDWEKRHLLESNPAHQLIEYRE
jgi:peptide chain release factor 3